MSVSALSEPPVTTNGRILPSPDPRDPQVRLPLRTELFLLSHDDDTGNPHLNQRALSLGLAAAILLELWQNRRILIGKAFRVRDGYYTPDPGRITIIDPTPLGDPLSDAALSLLQRTGGPTYVADFLGKFATPDMYDRVQGDMIARGILRRWTRRRFRFFRQDTFRATTPVYAVRTRAWLRSLAHPRNTNDQPHVQTTALAGLVTALGLTRNLYHADSAALHAKLTNTLYRNYDNTIRDVTNTLNPHGHLARRTR